MLRSLKRPGSGFDDLVVIVVRALGRGEIKDRGGLPEGVTVFQKPVPFSEIQALASDLRHKLNRSALPA